jgi:hypothetical protein
MAAAKQEGIERSAGFNRYEPVKVVASISILGPPFVLSPTG